MNLFTGFDFLDKTKNVLQEGQKAVLEKLTTIESYLPVESLTAIREAWLRLFAEAEKHL